MYTNNGTVDKISLHISCSQQNANNTVKNMKIIASTAPKRAVRTTPTRRVAATNKIKNRKKHHFVVVFSCLVENYSGNVCQNSHPEFCFLGFS